MLTSAISILQSASKRTRYCDPKCAAAGWEAHRQACTVLALKAQKGQPEPPKHLSCSFGYIVAEAVRAPEMDNAAACAC